MDRDIINRRLRLPQRDFSRYDVRIETREQKNANSSTRTTVRE